jgi:hypothetical protein
MSGKNVKLFLVDGSPTGLIVAEIGNWSGVVLAVPQAELARLSDRAEARRPGVYILAGSDPERPGVQRAYVGEAENVFARLVQHNQRGEKDYWSRTALLLGTDGNLTKSHIRYLESRLIEEAREAARATLDNATLPNRPHLPDGEAADMECFLSHARLLLPLLGFDLLQRVPRIDDTGRTSGDRDDVFELDSDDVRARMIPIDGEFVVLKGSRARKPGRPGWSFFVNLRDQLVEDGVLVDSDNPQQYEFSRDYAFPNVSASASVVDASNGKGRFKWRHAASGRTLKEWEAAQLDAAAGGETEERTK